MYHFIAFPPNRKFNAEYFSQIENNFLKLYNVRAGTFKTKYGVRKISQMGCKNTDNERKIKYFFLFARHHCENEKPSYRLREKTCKAYI